MRTAGSFVLWLVALAAFTVTLPMAWLATNVSDEDGYVRFTAPFATDSELREALADGVADQVVKVTDVQVGQALLRRVVDRAFERLIDDPEFPRAWQESQRSSHRATFSDEQEQRVVVDLAPFLEPITDDLVEQLPGFVEAPDQLLVPVTREVRPDTIDAVREAPPRALAGAVIAVVATVGSLLLARRRSTTFGWWGLGVAGVGAGYMVLTSGGAPALLRSDAAGSELASAMRELLLARAISSFDDWTLVAVVVGGVAALVGFGVRLLRR